MKNKRYIIWFFLLFFALSIFYSTRFYSKKYKCQEYQKFQNARLNGVINYIGGSTLTTYVKINNDDNIYKSIIERRDSKHQKPISSIVQVGVSKLIKEENNDTIIIINGDKEYLFFLYRRECSNF